MSELVRSGGWLERSDARRVGRGLSRLNAQGHMQMAEIAQVSEVQVEKIAAIAHVARAAQTELTMLTQSEVQLCALVPSAAARIQGIGDIACIAMADVLADVGRRVR